jgi:uncharacterized protein
VASATFATPGSTLLFGLGGPVFLLGVFSPGVVAIALTAYRDGRAGVAELLGRIGMWQASPWLYLFAITYLAATKLIAAVLHRLLIGTWPAFGTMPVLLMLGGILISFWAQAGEEVGWRGYALPRLAARLGLNGASVVLGVIWALWHLPLFYLAGSGSDGQSFPIYLLHVTALSVAMSWVYWRSGGSLLLVMLMHSAVNNTTGIVPTAVPGATDQLSFGGSTMAWLTTGVAWVVAAVLLIRMRRVGTTFHPSAAPPPPAPQSAGAAG